MKRIHLCFLTTAALLSAAASLIAADTTVSVGDPAPKLQNGQWIQGEPVTGFAKDKAYIVEFWATWCGPCRSTIPHLNEIHQKFKDKGLVVIGQDVWETDESQVKPFVEKMGDKMTYRVALDDKTEKPKGAMAETWMEAAGQRGIPAAFLVGKDGKIAWIGHPMSLKESVIEEVLAGKFDVQKAAAEHKKQQEAEGKISKLSAKFGEAMSSKKWDEADATLTEIAQLLPEEQREAAEAARLQILLGKGDLDAAAVLAEKVSLKNKTNPVALNQLAWMLVSQENLKGTALATAHKLAVQANEAAAGKDPGILDTLARATYLTGDKAKAIELQGKAVQLAEEESAKKSLQETLDSYKAGKLPKAQ